MPRVKTQSSQKDSQALKWSAILNGLDRAHLAALEDLSPGLLIWVNKAWRRNGDSNQKEHSSRVIHQLLQRGLIETSHDNLTITPLGIRARHHLDLRIKNMARLRNPCSSS